MAENKAAPDKRKQFENAVYNLGLTLIDRYLTGAYSANEGRVMLETVVEIFKCTREGEKRG